LTDEVAEVDVKQLEGADCRVVQTPEQRIALGLVLFGEHHGGCTHRYPSPVFRRPGATLLAIGVFDEVRDQL
jgi:hypothetical protein